MCGIFGFTKRTPEVEKILPYLALKMAERGKDSWGVTDGYHVQKNLGSILDSWVPPTWGDMLVFHTRAGSVGDKTLKNQHPFAFNEIDVDDNPTGSYIVGVHNGGISNHGILNTKYKREFPVDSMHVYAHMAEGWPLDELCGYGALVWFRVNERGERILNFCRVNMFDLHIFEIEDDSHGLVFCSTASAFEDIAQLHGIPFSKYKTEENHVYSLSIKDDGRHTLIENGNIKFGARYRQSSVVYPNSYHHSHSRGSSDDILDDAWGICPYCHYGMVHCQCDDGENGSKTIIVNRQNTSTTAMELYAIAGRGNQWKETELKAGCVKCRVGMVLPGKELFCQSCLFSLIRTYCDTGKFGYDYRY
jgi:hypothetical protein